MRQQAELREYLSHTQKIEAMAAIPLMQGGIGSDNAIRWIIRLSDGAERMKSDIGATQVRISRHLRHQNLTGRLAERLSAKLRSDARARSLAAIIDSATSNSQTQDDDDRWTA